jgi:hypothetical protein
MIIGDDRRRAGWIADVPERGDQRLGEEDRDGCPLLKNAVQHRPAAARRILRPIEDRFAIPHVGGVQHLSISVVCGTGTLPVLGTRLI